MSCPNSQPDAPAAEVLYVRVGAGKGARYRAVADGEPGERFRKVVTNGKAKYVRLDPPQPAAPVGLVSSYPEMGESKPASEIEARLARSNVRTGSDGRRHEATKPQSEKGVSSPRSFPVPSRPLLTPPPAVFRQLERLRAVGFAGVFRLRAGHGRPTSARKPGSGFGYLGVVNTNI